jgi:hypothetical protein
MKRNSKWSKPSPAFLVAVIALFAALGGGAVAGVTVNALNKKEKKQVKRISKKQAKKQAKKQFPKVPAGPEGSKGPQGEIGTAYRNGNAEVVYVKTRDSGGLEADRSFRLAVIC